MKRFKGCLGVFAIFLLGALAGGFFVAAGVNQQLFRWFMAGAPGGPDKAVDAIAKRLRRELKLNGEQQQALQEIVRETQGKLSNITKQTQPEVNATLKEAEARVRAILNPEQTRKFDRIVQRSRERSRAAPATPAATPAAATDTLARPED